MSDRVTNVEIEDMLSSIRRLVTAEPGRARPPEPSRRSGGGSVSKLVLTDDFRVGKVAQPEPEAAAQPAVATREDYTRSLERRIAELEAAVNAQQTEFEPDGSEDTSQHRPTAYLFAVPRPQADVGLSAPTGAVNGDAEALPEALAGEVQEETTIDHDDMWNGQRVSSISQQADLDNDDGFTFADNGPEAAGHADDNREDRLRYSELETMIDEEALRDMVAEIVRDELQGALGERITRNVRKLVRREIMRAISIRDFE